LSYENQKSASIVVAVQGAAIGGGTTMLTHCDFVFAGERAQFQMPFVNLALVPEFGSSYSVPARVGYLRAAELILQKTRAPRVDKEKR
jgi:enoyl-CoA hydratase/carnithine racemase